MKDILKNKKITIGLIVIIILFIIIGALFLRKGNDNYQNNKLGLSQNNLREEMSAKINLNDFVGKIKKEYKNSPTFQECWQNMSLQECLTLEVNKKLESEKNTKYCKDLILDDNIKNCIEGFKYKQAINDKNVEICKELDTLKDSCIAEIVSLKARESLDTKICEENKDQLAIDNCKNTIIFEKARKELDPKVCKGIVGPEKDICELDVKMIIEQNNFDVENKVAS